MSKKVTNTREALRVLQTFVEEDRQKAEAVEEAARLLNAALDSRAQAVQAALDTLEGYVAIQSQAHGIDIEVQDLIESARKDPEAVSTWRYPDASGMLRTVSKKKAKKKKAAKKKATKKAKSSSTAKVPVEGKLTGYPDELDATITYSENERKVVKLLLAQWPAFVTPEMIIEVGAITKVRQSSSLVTRLRRKGVPIESARQARNSYDENIPEHVKGYRLIRAGRG